MAKKHTKLYEILGVSETASQTEITKAYKLCALKHHPDKNLEKNKKTAQEFFLQVQNAYNILKDPIKRENYDKHGYEDEESIAFKKAYEYFQFLFAKVTEEEILNFEKTYKNSDAQKEDLIQFYNQFKGDISKLLEWIPLSSPDEIQFYIDSYNELFKQNLLKENKNFKKSIPQLKKNAENYKIFLKKEKKKFNKLNSTKDNGMQSLILLMEKNKKKHTERLASLIENLESKYSKEKKTKNVKKDKQAKNLLKTKISTEEKIKVKKKNILKPQKKIDKKGKKKSTIVKNKNKQK